MRLLPCVLILGACLVFILPGPATPKKPAPKDDYEGIPVGFDFPAEEKYLLDLRDTENVSKMRLHAWLVFAGLSHPTDGGGPVWETWYSKPETYKKARPQKTRRYLPSRVQLASRIGKDSTLDRRLLGVGRGEAFGENALDGQLSTRQLSTRQLTQPVRSVQARRDTRSRRRRKFERPQQLELMGVPRAVGQSIASEVLFNQSAFNHIRNQRYYLKSELTRINKQFSKDGTPVAKRAIKPFPHNAVALKLVWQPVKQKGLTPLPVWDFEPACDLDKEANGPETWKRCVAVDPSRKQIPANEMKDVVYQGKKRPKSHVVPLDSFYYFRVSKDLVAALEEYKVKEGDYMVLVAMHYTTKEIPDWVWATFWWHDRPNHGPLATDRPAKVTGVWRNYLMNVAYSMESPREYDGTPRACFNPWVESFAKGMRSNCMTCHQLAVWPSKKKPVPVTRGAQPPNSGVFVNKTKLDFLWTIALSSK